MVNSVCSFCGTGVDFPWNDLYMVCVTSLFTGNWIIQAIVFIVVTVIVLLVLRPIAVKYINNKAERTNVESMEGKTGKVISEIDNINAKGMVLIDGMEWTARSVNEDIIPENTLVEVVTIEGVKAIVKIKE